MFKKICLSILALFPLFAGAKDKVENLQEELKVMIQIDGKFYEFINAEQLKEILDEAELEEVDIDEQDIQMAGSYITESTERN